MKAFTLARADAGRIEDALALVAAFHAVEGVAQTPAARRRALETLLTPPEPGELWLIEVGGRAIGYIAIAYGYSIEFGGRDGFVDEFFVDAAHRGAGIGRAALRDLARDLSARGFHALHLEVAETNERAIRLYEAEGFSYRRGYRLMSGMPGGRPGAGRRGGCAAD